MGLGLGNFIWWIDGSETPTAPAVFEDMRQVGRGDIAGGDYRLALREGEQLTALIEAT